MDERIGSIDKIHSPYTHDEAQCSSAQNRGASEEDGYMICLPSSLERLWGTVSTGGSFPSGKCSLSITLTVCFYTVLMSLYAATTSPPTQLHIMMLNVRCYFTFTREQALVNSVQGHVPVRAMCIPAELRLCPLPNTTTTAGNLWISSLLEL